MLDGTDGDTVEYRETTIILAHRLAVEAEVCQHLVFAQRLNLAHEELVRQLQRHTALREAVSLLLADDDHAYQMYSAVGNDLPWWNNLLDIPDEVHRVRSLLLCWFLGHSTCQFLAWLSHLLKRRVIIHRTMRYVIIRQFPFQFRTIGVRAGVREHDESL